MARSEGQTLLEVLCSHCALSPRAPRSVVQLSGAPGFPPSLWGTCGTCYSRFREGVRYSGEASGCFRAFDTVGSLGGLHHAAPGCFGTANTIGFVRIFPPRGEQPFRTPFGEGGEINK